MLAEDSNPSPGGYVGAGPHGSGRDRPGRRGPPLRISWLGFVVAALLVPSAAAQADSVAPDVLAVNSFMSQVDVRNKGCSRVSCGEPWAGPTPVCSDVKCKVNPVFVVTVKDTSGSSADVSGVGKVTLRLANPRAVAQGEHATSVDDGSVDRALFQLVTVTIPSGQTGIGGSASGDMINLSAQFDGYSLSGEWVLDSIRISDQAGNVRLLESADLDARGLGVSIDVATLQAGQCKGACANDLGGSGLASCMLYSTGLMDEAWWDCESDPSLEQTPGVCCSPCAAPAHLQPLEVRGLCDGTSVVPSPLCGCYRGNMSSGWGCSFSSNAPASMKAEALCPGGPSSQCSGVGESDTCGPHGSHALGVLATSSPAPVQGGGAQTEGARPTTTADVPRTTPLPANGDSNGTSDDAVGEDTSAPPAQTPGPVTSDSGQSELGFGFVSGMLVAVAFLCALAACRHWRSRQALGVWFDEHARIIGPRSSTSIMPPDSLRQGSTQRRLSPAPLLFPNSNAIVPVFMRQVAATDLESQGEGSLRRGPRPRRGSADAISREDVRVLRGMGFPLPLAVQALAATRMRGAQTAAEWIIENGLHDMGRTSSDTVTAPVAWPGANAVYGRDSHSWSTGDAHRATREAAHRARRYQSASHRQVVGFADAQDLGWGPDDARANHGAHVRVRGSNESGADRSRLAAPLTAAEARQYRRSMRLAHARQHPLKQKQGEDFNDKSAQDHDDGIGGECCVCMDRSVEARLVPCGHADMCMKCAAAIFNADQPCPLCRTAVEAYTRIQTINAHRKS